MNQPREEERRRKKDKLKNALILEGGKESEMECIFGGWVAENLYSISIFKVVYIICIGDILEEGKFHT